MSDASLYIDSCHDLIVKLRRRWENEFGQPLDPRTVSLLFEKSSEWLSARFCATKIDVAEDSSESASAHTVMEQDHDEDEEEEEFARQSEPETTDSSGGSIAAADILPGWNLIYEFQVAWQTATSSKLDMEITLLLHEQAANTMRMPADAEPQAATQSNLSSYRIASANGAKLQVRWCRECFIIITLSGGVTPEKLSKTSFSWSSYKSIELAWQDVVATSGWDRPVRKIINNPERTADQ